MTSTAKVILAHVQWKTNEDFFKLVHWLNVEYLEKIDLKL